MSCSYALNAFFYYFSCSSFILTAMAFYIFLLLVCVRALRLRLCIYVCSRDVYRKISHKRDRMT